MSDSKPIIYLGIDIAALCGVAVYIPEKNRALVFETKGTPVQQLEEINWIVQNCTKDAQVVYVVFEKQYYFRNANTTRDLLERYGFLKWSLMACGFDIWEVGPSTARAFLGIPYNPKTASLSKRRTFDLLRQHYASTAPFTTNHSDALAVAMKQAFDNGHLYELKFPEIYAGEIGNLESRKPGLGNLHEDHEDELGE